MAPFFRPHLLALFIRLEQAGVSHVLEITEREDIHAFPQAAAVFRLLAVEGLRFAVDDFGTGHASPALLSTYRAAFIKLDRKFISDPVSTVADRMIARTVSLTRHHGARVIAEGIETPEQDPDLRRAALRQETSLLVGQKKLVNSHDKA